MPKIPSEPYARVLLEAAQKIQYALYGKRLRFSELLEITSLYPATLARKLRELEKLRLVKKDITNEPGEQVEVRYSQTDVGTNVYHALVEMNEMLKRAGND